MKKSICLYLYPVRYGAVHHHFTGTAFAADAPVPNKGDTSWMIVATVLVSLMTIPGLALFYGGLVRTKNMLSLLMQVFTVFSLCMVLWVIYGYSLAFTEGNAFFGGFSKIFLKGSPSIRWPPLSARGWLFPN